MSDSESTSAKTTVKTDDGREITLVCPVCGNDHFITARTPASESGAGFQHVIVGREMITGNLPATKMLPVKFRACSNCGYILKFLIADPT